MRGGVVPPALLFAALACALAFAPPRARWSALIAVAVAVAASRLPLPAGWTEPVFLGCWLSVVVTGALVHRPVGARAAVGLAVNAGVWAGATVAVTATQGDIFAAAPFVAVVVPAAWAVARGWGIAVKVAASWLIAIAVLAALLPLVPTPGYAPDHLE